MSGILLFKMPIEKEFPRIPEIQDERISGAYREGQIGYCNEQGKEDFENVSRLRQELSDIEERTGFLIGRGPILDLGCGLGSYTRQLAKVFSCSFVVGIDNDPRAIELAKSYDNPSNLQFMVGDVYHLDKYHGGVGLATVTNSLHHFDDLDGVLKQISDLLVHRGALFIDDLDRRGITEDFSEEEIEYLYDLRRRCADSECLEALEKEGFFEPDKIGSFVYLLSMVAAYTADEVAAALKKHGLQPKIESDVNGEYSLLAVKC